MSNIVTKRFVQCHNKLKEDNLIRSSRQFALACDYAPQSLSEVLKGSRDATVELLRKSIQVYNLNPNYLFMGEGAMLIDDSSTQKNPILTVVTNNQLEEKISYVPVAAQAGYGGQLYDTSFMEVLPSFSLPGHEFGQGTYRCFDISGKSMEPSLLNRQKVVCSFVEKEYWSSSIRNNQVYVIVTDDSVVVKRVINLIEEASYIKLISDNPQFNTYKVNIQEIKEVWQVKVVISDFDNSKNGDVTGIQSNLDSLKDTVNQQTTLIKNLHRSMESLARRNRSLV